MLRFDPSGEAPRAKHLGRSTSGEAPRAKHLGRSITVPRNGQHFVGAGCAREALLVSRDKDFGGLVFVQHLGKGVIYLRITPSTMQATHDELKRVLEVHSESDLANAFVVVEPGRHRFRKLD